MIGKIIKNYNGENLPKGLTHQDWNFMHHYFKHTDKNPIGSVPEKITTYIKPLIPNYVDTIVNFGCSNGRDFIPFHDDYKLVGFDLVSPDYMDFAIGLKTDNLTYYQCSMQDFITDFNHSDLDLSKSLVYTSATLMYLETDKQEEFVNDLIKLGCKNMVFQEYINNPTHNNVKFSEKLNNLFDIKSFKESPFGGVESDNLWGHIMLDENN